DLSAASIGMRLRYQGATPMLSFRNRGKNDGSSTLGQPKIPLAGGSFSVWPSAGGLHGTYTPSCQRIQRSEESSSGTGNSYSTCSGSPCASRDSTTIERPGSSKCWPGEK